MNSQEPQLPWGMIAESGIEAVLGSSLFGVAMTDSAWRVIFANDLLAKQFFLDDPIGVGVSLADVLGADRFAELSNAASAETPDSAIPTADIKFDMTDDSGRRGLVRVRSWPMVREGKEIGHVLVAIDISERYDDVRRYRVADDLIEAFMGVVSDVVVVTDAAGVITSVSDSAEDVFGWARHDLIGAHLGLLMSAGDVPSQVGSSANHQSIGVEGLAGKPRAVDGRRRNGEHFPMELRVVENVVGDPPGLVAFIRDLGEVHDLNRQIETAYRTDDLTGLLTRASFKHEVRSFALEADEPFSFVEVDVAKFHHVNNAYGYETGDQLLKAVAREILAVAPGMPAGRIGGDRFAFIAATGEVDRAVRALRSRVEGRGRSRGINHPIRLHVGVAGFVNGSIEGLMMNASSALRSAKAGAPGEYVEFDDSIASAIAQEEALLFDIHTAIRSRQLVTYFQPEIDLRTGAVIGHEALVRWNHPDRGLIPPDRFLPLARAENLMPTLGVQVLAASIEFVRKSNETGHVGRVWINLSSPELLDDSVLEYTRAAIEGGLDPLRLGFEVTEQDAFAVESSASDNLQSLVDLGVAIAIDDFGTGYSSLTQLRNIPAEVVKLDRSFLMAIHTDKMQERFVEGCINLAHTLGRVVVAEGIETAADAELVARLGCDMAQGYWYGRPVTAAAAIEKLG